MKLRWSLILAALLAFVSLPAAAQCPADVRCICTGDCNEDGEADIVELQGCVNGFLGENSCALCDANLDEEVGIVDLQGAINSFLDSSTCPLATLAAFEVGAVAGGRGSQVMLPIRLRASVDDVVIVAPLRLSFNAGALDFVECDSALNSLTAVSAVPSTGALSVVLYPDPFAQPAQELNPIPSGVVMNCRFNIKGDAPFGPSPVGFVFAGVADAEFRDFSAGGNGGTVTIQ